MAPRMIDIDARVSRSITPEVKHNTIYNKIEYTTFICKVCGEIGYYAEAFRESKTYRKHENHIRPYHASCYIKTNGRTRPKPEQPATILPVEVTATIIHKKTRKTKKVETPTSTLELFIMRSDNE